MRTIPTKDTHRNRSCTLSTNATAAYIDYSQKQSTYAAKHRASHTRARDYFTAPRMTPPITHF